LKLAGAAAFVAKMAKARREVDKLSRSTKRADRDTLGLRLQMGGLSTALRLSAVGLVVAAQGVGALGIATFALGAALAPVVGLLGAIPGLLSLAGQGFGVVAFSMAGVTKAVGGLNEAIDPDKFAELSGPAQRFALALDAMKAPLRDLQSSIGAAMFPGFVQGLVAARPALDALKGPLTGTGSIIGNLGARLGKLVGSRGFLNDLRSQAQFNNVQLKSLGTAGLRLVNVFRNLMVGSRGLVRWMVKGVASFAAWAERATTAGRASGGLQKGFHTVQVTTERVLKIFWRFGKALFNIGRIGKTQLGDGILVYLLRGATALEKWTRSEAGIRKISRAFEWARSALGGMGDVLRNMRTSAGGPVSELLRNLVAAINPIISSPGSGVILGLYAAGLNMIAVAAGALVRNVPGASFALSALFAVLILNKTLGIGKFATTLGTLGAAALIAATGTHSLTGAMWALNASFFASPLFWIPLAIAAVALGFYLLYTKVDWFRTALTNVWNFIQNNWQLLGGILVAPFWPMIEAMKWIIANWSKITQIATGGGGSPTSGAGLLLNALGVGGHAGGGIVRTPLQLVGERGPELAALPMGARVTPAPETRRVLRSPQAPTVMRSGGGGRNGPAPVIRNEIVLKLDRKVLTKAVNDVVADERANG
jgi:hypothetical protein